MDTLREIICEKRAYSYSPHTHDHNYSQLLFPLAGALDIQASEQHLTLQEGCFTFRLVNCIRIKLKIQMNVWLLIFL